MTSYQNKSKPQFDLTFFFFLLSHRLFGLVDKGALRLAHDHVIDKAEF